MFHHIHNAVASNVFGTLGTICWTGQVIPQILKSWRAKSTEGLSEWLMLTWGIASAPYGIYAIVQRFNIPLLLQPQCFGFLSIIAWGQCQYYGRHLALWKVILAVLGIYILIAGFEIGMVFAIRPATRKGHGSPAEFFGVLAMVLIAGGFIPQYVEIFKDAEVRGISLLFMFIDMCGGIFSLLSLMFQKPFNKPAGIAYSLVTILDGGILIAALILNPRAERRRQRECERDAERQEDTLQTVLSASTNGTGDADGVAVKKAVALSKKLSGQRRKSLLAYHVPKVVVREANDDMAMVPLSSTFSPHLEDDPEMFPQEIASAYASTDHSISDQRPLTAKE